MLVFKTFAFIKGVHRELIGGALIDFYNNGAHYYRAVKERLASEWDSPS